MTGIGPPAGSEHDRTPEPQTVDRDAAASLYHQAWADGQQSAVQGGYPAGHDLGHDVGYGARNDHARPFVAGILAGHAAGVDARRELAGDLMNQGRQPGTGQLPLPEPEQEAEAG